MTKSDIEKIIGKELSDNEVSVDKKIYAGKLYFYKREVEQDHYFYVPADDKLYKMIYNKSNYDPSVTETGKYADSFQYPFDDYLSDGKVIEISTTSLGMDIGIEATNQNKELSKESILKEMRSNCLKIAEIQMNQAELINKLLG